MKTDTRRTAHRRSTLWSTLGSVLLGTALAALAGHASGQSLCPPSYEITEWFQGPSCGIFGTGSPIPLSINDLGQIVGYYGCGPGPESGFRRDPNGTFVTLPNPSGYSQHRAWDINNAGQIAGTVVSPLPPRGYRRTGNVTTLIEPPEGWWGTEARAINEAGVVVGYATPNGVDNHHRAMIWDGETTTLIEPLLFHRAVAQAINDHGIAVGWMGSSPISVAQPFVWDGERATLLPLPEGAFTGQATAINNHGDVLVSAVMNEGLPNIVRPYLWRDGEYTALPFLEAYGRCWPLDINDSGVAVGYCDHHPQGAQPQRALAWIDGELIELMQPGPSEPLVLAAVARSVSNTGAVAGYVAAFTGSYGTVNVPVPAPTADLDSSGSVGVADLGMLLRAWGSTDSPADLNCDGIVDGADLGILLLHWGPAR